MGSTGERQRKREEEEEALCLMTLKNINRARRDLSYLCPFIYVTFVFM
jgi:hypothetical protein